MKIRCDVYVNKDKTSYADGLQSLLSFSPIFYTIFFKMYVGIYRTPDTRVKLA